MKQIFIFLRITFLSFVLLTSSCQDKKANTGKPEQKIAVATVERPVTPLFFSGVLSPIRAMPVVSPVDGRVASIYFNYGEYVNSGQLVAVISSQQLADDYQKAVTDYLQKKDSYENAIQTYKGNIMLHKAGLMSDADFLNAKSQYETAVLNYYQSQGDLRKVLKKANTNIQSIEKLTLSNLQAIRKVLQRQFSHIEVIAPGSGVALFPTPNGGGDSSDSDSNKSGGKLVVGSDLKAGQLMLNIGDKTGFSAKIAVSEIDINRIKVGMKAVITGDAFPNISLAGEVTDVASQANPQEGGAQGLSQFNVTVKIPNVPEQQRQLIHVGMTAKIQIDIHEKPKIMLPINAVFHRNGQAMVTLMDTNGKTKDVSVVTGETTPTQVSIISGIKAGDKVILHD